MSEGFGALQEHSQFGIGTVSLDLVALQEYSEFGSGLCLWIWWLCKSILNALWDWKWTVSLDLVALQEHSEFGRCTLCFYGFRAEEEEERVEFWVCF